MGGSLAVPEKSIHEFTVKDFKGKDVNLKDYKGKVLLVVNVASKCGFTGSNYTQLTDLYNKYKDKDFEILAFPCNQFLNQEPGTNEDIHEFACTRFKAEYPVFDKVVGPLAISQYSVLNFMENSLDQVRVNGSEASPVYKFLKANAGGFLGSGIKWNFTKFLVDKDGKVIGRYSPITEPKKLEKDIIRAIESK